MTRRMARGLFLSFLAILLTVFFPCRFYGEKVTDNDFGFELDLPEGFSVQEYTPDGLSYRFAHKFMAVSFLLKLYPDNIFTESEKALSTTMDKLNAKYDIDSFTWRNADCSIANFEMVFPGTSDGASGWGVSVQLPGKNADLVLLCYADKDKADDSQQFIISCLNSLCIDRGSYVSPGIFTSYAFPQSSETKTISLKIHGKEIKTQVSATDEEASKFVRDCEFAVFTLYASTEQWKEAWIRYYQAIYRDSASRIRKPAFDIYSALEEIAKEENPSNPEAAYNKLLLNWVQEFSYERNISEKTSDFSTPSEILCGKGSDCDGRSMLMCTLLKNTGIDCTFFVSKDYRHSVYGALINQEGAKIKVNGKEYLLGETTAKGINPGLMNQDFSDTEKWIPVPLP